MKRSFLKCIKCGRMYDVKEIRYNCDCGELLEIIHDLKSFGINAKGWKGRFIRNPQLPAFLRFKDVILPEIPNDKIVTLFEGDTPLYPADTELQRIFGIKNLYFKHEGMNPTLSFKDRGMVAAVSWALFLAVLAAICSSTGDTAASMAAYLARARMKGAVLLPEGKISFEQLCQSIAYGVKALCLQTDFDGCMKLVQKLPIYLLNSKNPVRIEGQKLIAIETLWQLGWNVPDWFVIPVGNAGNIAAQGKGLREIYELGIIDHLPRLAGIQSEKANPLYLSYKNGFAEFSPVVAKPTVASAIQIGNPVSAKKAIREVRYFDGVFEQVSDEEILDAKAILDASGISICPNSGAAVAGTRKLRDVGLIKETDLVVVILTAHGTKFSKTIIDYHQNPKAKFANPPKVLPATLEAIEEALNL